MVLYEKARGLYVFIILWEPWMSELNLTASFRVVGEKFQSEQECKVKLNIVIVEFDWRA